MHNAAGVWSGRLRPLALPHTRRTGLETAGKSGRKLQQVRYPPWAPFPPEAPVSTSELNRFMGGGRGGGHWGILKSGCASCAVPLKTVVAHPDAHCRKHAT